ncbi:MAG: hypothetical protein ACPK85_01480 [Methanosarcina sp.]
MSVIYANGAADTEKEIKIKNKIRTAEAKAIGANFYYSLILLILIYKMSMFRTR